MLDTCMSLITQRTPTSMGKFSIRSIEKASLEDLRELEAQLLNKKEKQKSKKEKELYELREWEKEQLASLEIAKLEELEIAKLAEIRQYKYNYVDLSDREYALLKIRSPEKWCIYCRDCINAGIISFLYLGLDSRDHIKEEM